MHLLLLFQNIPTIRNAPNVRTLVLYITPPKHPDDKGRIGNTRRFCVETKGFIYRFAIILSYALVTSLFAVLQRSPVTLSYPIERVARVHSSLLCGCTRERFVLQLIVWHCDPTAQWLVLLEDRSH
jgi:hypothetical protein